MKKIIFMGSSTFSATILKSLILEGYEILAVVTQPDRPVGRKKKITFNPVKQLTIELKITLLQPQKISEEKEILQIINLKPDLIITAAFGQFLPEKLLKFPYYGCINVHASLLPKYRGGAPVHYALINGEKKTGVTIMKMEKKIDAGEMYSQCSIPIEKKDDVGTMFNKLSILGKKLLIETLPKIFSNKCKAIPQNESKATFSYNINRQQEAISWGKTAFAISCQVRGMSPWPGAFTLYKGICWKIWKVETLSVKTEEIPGTIIYLSKKNIYIACGQKTVLSLLEIQPSGRKKQTISQFLNGSGKTIKLKEKLEFY